MLPRGYTPAKMSYFGRQNVVDVAFCVCTVDDKTKKTKTPLFIIILLNFIFVVFPKNFGPALDIRSSAVVRTVVDLLMETTVHIIFHLVFFFLRIATPRRDLISEKKTIFFTKPAVLYDVLRTGEKKSF